MKTRLVIILAFGITLGVILMIGAHRANRPLGVSANNTAKPASVRCAQLIKQNYTSTESFYGLIEAQIRVDMAFQIAGRIERLGNRRDTPLKENQIIQEGSVIARLEPLRYEAAVQQANAAMETAKAEMATASAQIAQANAQLQDAKRDLRRLLRLRDRQATTSREVEKAKLQLQLAKAALESARAMLSSAQAAYRSARAASTMANVNLQDTVLTSPMKATVAAMPVEIGQMVEAGQTVATLMDLSKAKLVVGVVERKVPLLQEGQKVSVDVLALSSQADLLSDSDLLSQPHQGLITVVPPAADQDTGLFDVEIELDNEERLLRPGMIGKATVTVTEHRAFAIPASVAVRSGDRAWAMFVSRGAGLDPEPVSKVNSDAPATVAQRVWFKPLLFDKEYYLVKELTDGLDQLIVEGHRHLEDGQAVRVIDTVSDPALNAVSQN